MVVVVEYYENGNTWTETFYGRDLAWVIDVVKTYRTYQSYKILSISE